MNQNIRLASVAGLDLSYLHIITINFLASWQETVDCMANAPISQNIYYENASQLGSRMRCANSFFTGKAQKSKE